MRIIVLIWIWADDVGWTGLPLSPMFTWEEEIVVSGSDAFSTDNG